SFAKVSLNSDANLKRSCARSRCWGKSEINGGLGGAKRSACQFSLQRCAGVCQPSKTGRRTAQRQCFSLPIALRPGRLTRLGDPPEREPSQPSSTLSGRLLGCQSPQLCFVRYE